jgi:hypothetical protein
VYVTYLCLLCVTYLCLLCVTYLCLLCVTYLCLLCVTYLCLLCVTYLCLFCVSFLFLFFVFFLCFFCVSFLCLLCVSYLCLLCVTYLFFCLCSLFVFVVCYLFVFACVFCCPTSLEYISNMANFMSVKSSLKLMCVCLLFSTMPTLNKTYLFIIYLFITPQFPPVFVASTLVHPFSFLCCVLFVFALCLVYRMFHCLWFVHFGLYLRLSPTFT